jgi:nitrite reductase (NADH) small subunit
MAEMWIEIGGIADIPQRGSRLVHLGDVPVAVFRTGEDELFALVNRCPHRGGPLSEGIVSGRSVTCPLHNWVIDLASGKAHEPDIGCVPTVPLRLVDGRILIEVSALRGSCAHGAAA